MFEAIAEIMENPWYLSFCFAFFLSCFLLSLWCGALGVSQLFQELLKPLYQGAKSVPVWQGCYVVVLIMTLLLGMQSPAVRQQLLDLRAMDFLIQQVSLEADLHMNVSLPVSPPATTTTGPTEISGLHSAAVQPSSCPSRPSGSLESSRLPTIPGVPEATAEPPPWTTSYRRSSSRLRLPALPPGTARSPRISARYPGLQANGSAASRVGEPALGRVNMSAGFVSTGDLEEDTQQLLEMESEVHTPLPCCSLRQHLLCIFTLYFILTTSHFAVPSAYWLHQHPVM